MTGAEALEQLRALVHPALLWPGRTLVQAEGGDHKGARSIELDPEGGRALIVCLDVAAARVCSGPRCDAQIELQRWLFPTLNAAHPSLTTCCDFLVAFAPFARPGALYWLLFELKNANARGAGRQLANGVLVAQTLSDALRLQCRRAPSTIAYRGILTPTRAPDLIPDRKGRYPFVPGETLPGWPKAHILALRGASKVSVRALCCEV